MQTTHIISCVFLLYNLNADLKSYPHLFSHHVVKSLASWVSDQEPALAEQGRLGGLDWNWQLPGEVGSPFVACDGETLISGSRA